MNAHFKEGDVGIEALLVEFGASPGQQSKGLHDQLECALECAELKQETQEISERSAQCSASWT
jgi:hypothetical protein